MTSRARCSTVSRRPTSRSTTRSAAPRARRRSLRRTRPRSSGPRRPTGSSSTASVATRRTFRPRSARSRASRTRATASSSSRRSCPAPTRRSRPSAGSDHRLIRSGALTTRRARARQVPFRPMLTRLLAGLMGLAARRPLAVAGTVLVLAAAGAVLAMGLQPRADTDTLVGKSTAGYAATQDLHRTFGDDAVYVVVREPVSRVVLTEDLNSVLGLEGCLSGNVPAGRTPVAVRAVRARGSPRRSRRRWCSDPERSSTRPSGRSPTSSARRTRARSSRPRARGRPPTSSPARRASPSRPSRTYAAQAKQLVTAQFYRDILLLATKYGLTSPPSLNDPRFIARLVFDSRRGVDTPKARFALDLPGARRRADPGAAARRAQRAAARPRDREHPRRVADAAVASLRGHVRRHRRARSSSRSSRARSRTRRSCCCSAPCS